MKRVTVIVVMLLACAACESNDAKLTRLETEMAAACASAKADLSDWSYANPAVTESDEMAARMIGDTRPRTASQAGVDSGVDSTSDKGGHRESLHRTSGVPS